MTIAAIVALKGRDESDRLWAQAKSVSHMIPATVDLNRPADVARALLEARLQVADFEHVLGDAIAFAMLNRIELFLYPERQVQ